MKKQTVISIVLLAALAAGTSVSAQTTVQADASADIESNTGGGLGKGISHMVRNILGDDASTEAATFAAPAAPEASLMMQAQSSGVVNAAPSPAPQAFKATFKSASFAADTVQLAPMTKDDLRAYISGLLESDSNLQSVDTSESHVRVTYAVPAKIFRVVPVIMKVTAGAYASGGTDVSYPWYAFAASHASAAFKASLNTDVAPLIPSGDFSLEDQKTLIDTLHVTLAATFGSSTRGDQ